MIHIKRNITVWLLMLAMASCQKDYDFFEEISGMDTSWVTTVSPLAPVAELQSTLMKPFLMDSFNVSGQVATLINNQGLRCIFPVDLVTQTGTLATGEVTLHSYLFNRKGDFIRNQISTVSNNGLLETNGILFIRLKKNEETVSLSQSPARFQYEAPGLISGLQVYFSSSPEYWQKTGSPQMNNVIFSQNNYIVNTMQLGWMAAAKPVDSLTDPLRVSISLPSQYTNSNTCAWVVLNHKTSIIKMEADMQAKKFRCSLLPPNQDITIIVLSKQAGSYFMGKIETNTSMAASQTLGVTPVINSLQNINTYLDSL